MQISLWKAEVYHVTTKNTHIKEKQTNTARNEFRQVQGSPHWGMSLLTSQQIPKSNALSDSMWKPSPRFAVKIQRLTGVPLRKSKVCTEATKQSVLTLLRRVMNSLGNSPYINCVFFTFRKWFVPRMGAWLALFKNRCVRIRAPLRWTRMAVELAAGPGCLQVSPPPFPHRQASMASLDPVSIKWASLHSSKRQPVYLLFCSEPFKLAAPIL